VNDNRIAASDMTQEDCEIWVQIGTGKFWASLFDLSDWQDSRDADLLCKLRDFGPRLFPAHVRHVYWAFFTVKLTWDVSPAEEENPSRIEIVCVVGWTVGFE